MLKTAGRGRDSTFERAEIGMLERLFPREGNEFFDFFEQHAAKTLEATERLRAMLAEPGDASAHAARIKVLEDEGDKITHRTIEMLHHVFLAPIERGDIHRLISRLDDVLDLVEATSERLWLYEIREIRPDTHALVEVLVRAVTHVRDATRRLRDLRDTQGIFAVCADITRQEKEGDRLLRQAKARLFEETQDARHVMMWKEIYQYLEEATDRCQDVADVLEGIALGYA